jgi:hypothetical protein
MQVEMMCTGTRTRSVRKNFVAPERRQTYCPVFELRAPGLFSFRACRTLRPAKKLIKSRDFIFYAEGAVSAW